MISILMSIKPKWVEKIASGEKTVEVRKLVPECGAPFKVYMYCTNDRKETLNLANGRGFGKKGELYLNGNCYYPYTFGTLNGKVVGEFVCDNINRYSYFLPYSSEDTCHSIPQEDLGKICLDCYEIDEYLEKKDGYGLHISDLKIYDTPRELSEFRKPCNIKCVSGCPFLVITRPPRIFCYVEELL